MVPSAFSGISIGNWRTHYSYSDVRQINANGEKIYAVANGKLFSVDRDSTIETYSKLTGLNGFDIACIGWSDTEKVLLIVYTDGNIDFLSETGIDNLPDFKNKSITSDKTVYSLRVDGRFAYISTGVGLLVVDVRYKEIADTYRPLLTLNPFVVLDTVIDAVVLEDSIILATPRGLYAGNTMNNLLDPSQWSPLPFLSGLKPVSMVRFVGHVFILASDHMVYKQSGDTWTPFRYDNQALKLLKDDQYLYICAADKSYLFDTNLDSIVLPVPATDISYDTQNERLYIASGRHGLIKLRPESGSYVTEGLAIIPNSPGQMSAWNAFFKDGVYFSTTGTRWGNRNFVDGDILTFDGETWTGMKGKETISTLTGVPFQDLMNLVIDPEDDGHFFVTSWGEGLYEFRDSLFFKLHNQYNSPLVTLLPGRFCRVDGATFDQQGNLWLLNSTYGLSNVSDTTIWVLKPDGKWQHLFYEKMPSAPTWNAIVFTSHDQVWCNSVRGLSYGLFVLDQNGTNLNTADDKTRWFSSFTDQDGILLSPFTINCITEDLNGTIWIGTNLGPIVANNPSNIFKNDYTFTRIKIPRNDGTNSADYLLNEIRINCIAVDGANRKWVGTNGNGLYLISSNGIETIHRFTTENSPLPSDNIMSIAIHPETGEVFAGTSAGLVSYRSDAIKGKDTYEGIRVFPNPVTPGYSGLITVTGLKEKSQVKITDLNGNLLIAGTSLGGQFSWNGLNRQGQRVGSGVYLVFSSSEDGTEYRTCKFMVVN